MIGLTDMTRQYKVTLLNIRHLFVCLWLDGRLEHKKCFKKVVIIVAAITVIRQRNYAPLTNVDKQSFLLETSIVLLGLHSYLWKLIYCHFKTILAVGGPALIPPCL